MRKIVFFFCFVFVLSLSAEGFSRDVDFSADIGISRLTGDNTYNILDFPFLYGTGESKLEWDVDNYLLDLGVQADYRDKFILSFEYSTSISSGSGKMRDRDWYYEPVYNFYFFDLISDTSSNVESDVSIYDLRLRWKMRAVGASQNFRPVFSIGYLNQKWDGYEAYDLEGYQTFLGLSEMFSLTSSTPYITYEIEHKIPYIGIGAEIIAHDRVRVVFSLDYSSIAESEDKDDHVERGKTAETDANGDYYSFKGEVLWEFHEDMMLSLFVKKVKIETDGKQTQTWYKAEGSTPAGTTLTVDRNDISSDQIYFGVKYTYLFP
ncbi:MAG: omptin family outer membrane protease [Candidatus Aureabacteria bacterium]|nr:omptin family outer membrane protease [Candidatus Auribacterota bacterium]